MSAFSELGTEFANNKMQTESRKLKTVRREK
jgi:hypothetical protein